MLTPEQAQEQLKAVRRSEGPERRRAAVEALSGAVREIGRQILEPVAFYYTLDGLPEEQKQRALARMAALEQIDTLDAREQVRLFEALFPLLGRHVQAMWQLCRGLPYQAGGYRQAFRAPGVPGLTLIPRRMRLDTLLWVLNGYEQEIKWVAEWAAHLAQYTAQDTLGLLLAAAIEAGGPEGEQVFQIVEKSAGDGAGVAAMGRHVPRALLCASRQDGWEAMERLLLAAQRQEGLRQTILEAVDEAHPEAFRRLVQMVLEHDLLRFSSVVRALDVWFGGGWESGEAPRLRDFLLKLLPLWDDRALRHAALSGPDPEAVYLALWLFAYEDAPAAISLAAPLVMHPEAGHRFAAVHLLAATGLTTAGDALVPALDDADLRVVVRALDHLGLKESTSNAHVFERLECVLPRFPKRPQELEPVLWPWHVQVADRKKVIAALISHLGDRPVDRLTVYLPELVPDQRALVAGLLAEKERWTAEDRATLVRLVGDASPQVRDRALRALQKHTLAPDEARVFEGFLTRKAPDLRLGALEALLRQEDAAALATADRLLVGEASQRTAGLEMLRRLVEGDRHPEECARRATEYRIRYLDVSEAEAVHLDAVLRDRSPAATGAEAGTSAPSLESVSLDDALGLLDHSARSRPPVPQPRPITVATPAALALLQSLDDLVHQNREQQVTGMTIHGSPQPDRLLGDMRWLPRPDPSLSREADMARLPLRELWETWWNGRGPELRDADGLEAERATELLGWTSMLMSRADLPEWEKKLKEVVFGPPVERPALRYAGIVSGVLGWLIRIDPHPLTVDFHLDVLETTLARLPDEELTRQRDASSSTWNRSWRMAGLLNAPQYRLREHRALCPEAWDTARLGRLWGLLRWIDEPVREKAAPRGILAMLRKQPPPEIVAIPGERSRPSLEDTLPAFETGAATEADLIDLILGTRAVSQWGGSEYFTALSQLCGRRPHARLNPSPAVLAIAERCRRRILDVELTRGDTPTAATGPAQSLRYTGGMETLVRVLRALGRESFARGYGGGPSRQTVFSHLLRHTFPGEEDTFERFGSAVKEARIPESRLVELAVYAPQWAAHVERTLEWASLAGGVWWIHAHTKDESWVVDQEVRQAWEAEVAEFTPLTGPDLTEGAVDVQWFGRAYADLGPERWRAVYQAAKFASSSGGHTRAQLFAEAMLGSVDEEALRKRITEKRHPDSLRALGLLPLPAGAEVETVLDRYKAIQEFARGSRQFGAQRQETEKKAVRIAMENLARTAGYPDPVRLTWAMEARDIADLAAGPITVEAGEVSVSLSIAASGTPEVAVAKNGKPLKAVPPAVKKNPDVAALLARETDIKRQASRMRGSLEQAMIRGDAFTPAELAGLMEHPVLAPLLGRLVLVGGEDAGYPLPNGALQDASGREVRILGELRIAHPLDLLQRGDWHEWQQECFRAERIQPFKQVFRELYVLTTTEREEQVRSRRYEGHQVNPRQALALLTGRGWVAHPEEGVRKTFHEAGLTARLEAMGLTFTAADVEGLTLETVQFNRRGEWTPLPLESVPPRLFSEVMRDLDLVVSVAHRGGVDPEVSASTVEMRASLLNEMSRLMCLENVRIEGRWALIEGKLGHYSLHLGSAVVHRQPGGFLCIVPVHSQHRGRIFLPFADDDPKTAEVLAKTLLLAKDHEIKDPSILEQIRGSVA